MGVGVSSELMSTSDRDHWVAVQRWREDHRPGAPTADPIAWLTRAGSVLGTGLALLPGARGVADVATRVVGLADAADRVLADAARTLGLTEHVIVPVTDLLGEVGVRLGHAGLHAGHVVGVYRRAGHDVDGIAGVAALEVDDVLAVRPAGMRSWVLAALVQGALSTALAGLAVVGARHLALRVAVVVVGHAADTVLTVAACTRAVAHVGAFYGYDPSEDSGRERAIALAVLAVSVAGAAERPDADRLLRDLQDGGPVPPRLVAEVTHRLGSHLRGRDAVAAVPTVGPGLGAAVTARVVATVVDDADHLYRERFLRERYRTGAPTPPLPAAA